MDRTRQSGIQYLHTERTISEQIGRPIRDPIRVFDLEALDINKRTFLRELSPSFKELAWDQYEARRRRVEFLKCRFPSQTARLDAFLPMYFAEGLEAIEQVRDLLRQLSWEQMYAFDQIRSYRRRSIAKFKLSNRFHSTWEEQWRVEQVVMEGFVQQMGDPLDPRSYRRVFDETSANVIKHILFQRLIIAVAEMVEDAELDFDMEPTEIELTFHQMGLDARPGEAPTNAPEGLHKDGADYIISALVVEREGVDGGKSIIKADDRSTSVFEIELEPGQGIFQADMNSQLWHDVTPVTVRETAWGPAENAVRNIFGFDVMVTHRRRRRTP